jgi:choline-glycine betaine transporter
MLDWLSSWTVFYWAWWISWTPFVGMFLAKISRGRTIRQFVGGVILVPSLVSLVWFAIFGGAAISQQQAGLNPAAAGTEQQLFAVLSAYPWATFTGLLVMVLVAIFFVSGADAASIVTGTLSQRGTDEPSRWVVIFWGTVMGAVAIIMLLVGGEDALSGLQSLTILVAAPFVVIMVFLCIAFMRDLNHDPIVLRESKGLEVIEQAVDWGTDRHGDAFYLRVRAFEGTSERRAQDDAESTGPTYADVRGVRDPFAEDADRADDTRSVPRDDDPAGTEVVDSGPGGRAQTAAPGDRSEPAGRPSADRE